MPARVALLAVLAALAAPWGASAAELTETRREQLSPRLLELGFTTPALPAETNVRILLPDGYDADPARRYPVLYLLHGCCDADVDGSQAWTTHGEVEAATAGLPLIVVMPAGGKGGMYSDWQRAGTQGRPQWETYHLGQLVPWVDANLRTVAGREGRVIAGLSMGGFGALKYAALHPDRFVAAASFSGAVDSNTGAGAIHGALPGMDGGDPSSVWGPRATDELRWRSENPWDLAENLRPLHVELRTGNGQPGPLDEGGLPFDPVEAFVHANSVSVHDRLAGLGVGHVWDDYGPGTHTWPYWARSLRQTLTGFMDVLARPPAPPAAVTYRTARPAYEVFGWRVAFEREGLAWSRLAEAGPAGFVLEGAGRADVTLPATADPASAVTVDGRPAPVIVRDGRLTVPVATGEDERAEARIAAPATEPLACTRRRVVRLTLPRGLRRVRARLAGRPVGVRGRRVRADLRTLAPGTYRLVVRGRDRRGRPVRIVRRYRVCARR